MVGQNLQAVKVKLLGPLDSVRRKKFLLQTEDGRYFRASQSTCVILQLMDGTRSISQIARDCQDIYHFPVDEICLSDVIQYKFIPNGLIENTPEPRRVQGRRFTFLKVNLLSASRVASLACHCKVLFTPRLMALLSLISLTAHLVLYMGRPLTQAFTELGNSSQVLLLWVSLLLIGFLHELGHAAASLYWGVEPGAIGVGLYIVFPVFWTDLNSAWRLKRRQRATVDLGGVYLQWIVGMMLIAISYVSDAQWLIVLSFWNDLLLLYNLFPFLRLDGYWLVSDLMGVPNLNQEILDALKRLVRLRKPRIHAHLHGINKFAFYAYLMVVCLLMPFVVYRISFMLILIIPNLPITLGALLTALGSDNLSWSSLPDVGSLAWQALINLLMLGAWTINFFIPALRRVAEAIGRQRTI